MTDPIQDQIQHIVEANYDGKILALGVAIITKDLQCQNLIHFSEGAGVILLGGVQLLNKTIIDCISKNTTPLPPPMKK